jgi:flagellar basal-body rod protein FlgG
MVSRPLNTAASGMVAREIEIAVISNNVANINTTGYKKFRAEFQDLLYEVSNRPGSQTDDSGSIAPTGVQIGLGTKLSSTYPILTQGDIFETRNKYDLAIAGTTGKGYFKLELPNGTTAYTRAGSFRLNAEAEIVNDLGYKLSPGIQIPPNTIDVAINGNGQVYAHIAGVEEPQLINQIDLIDFPNPAGLLSIGGNLLQTTPASGTEIEGKANEEGMGEIKQYWLEGSNVDAVNELTSLITAQRGYELCSNIIKASDEIMQAVNRLKQ